jgi:hypothetical protein
LDEDNVVPVVRDMTPKVRCKWRGWTTMDGSGSRPESLGPARLEPTRSPSVLSDWTVTTDN